MNRRLSGSVGTALESVTQLLRRLSSFPPFGVVREIELAEGETSRKVNHGLRRRPFGWLVVYSNSSSYIYEDSSDTLRPSEYINFAFSAAIPASNYTQKMRIWFF